MNEQMSQQTTPMREPGADKGLEDAKAVLRGHLPMLDSAAIPTKSEVFVICGPTAREMHRAVTTVLSALSQGVDSPREGFGGDTQARIDGLGQESEGAGSEGLGRLIQDLRGDYDEVRSWSGSALVAGETRGKANDKRAMAELYSFLCHLGNRLYAYAEDLSALSAQPGTGGRDALRMNPNPSSVGLGERERVEREAYQQGWTDRENDLIAGVERITGAPALAADPAPVRKAWIRLYEGVRAFLADEDSLVEELLASGEHASFVEKPFPRIVELRSAMAALASLMDQTLKPHAWFDWRGMKACRSCGIVRNATSDTRTCKGPVKVGLRPLGANPLPVVGDRAREPQEGSGC
jgi:hypothetical protein